MNRKLTLSLDESIIAKAKSYGENKNKSLSQMVENYFKMLTSESAAEEIVISPLVNELIGSVKAPSNINFEDVKYDYLVQKHLHD